MVCFAEDLDGLWCSGELTGMEKRNDRAASVASAKSQLVTPVGQLAASDKKAYCGFWITR
jgi:hypothetical protein